MFNPDKRMREMIFDILRTDGMSISALSRELEGRGINIHRLILTGYLRALTDINELREKEVPPAKIYVPVKNKEKDVYELVGEHSRDILPSDEADRLIVYALNRLFKRPVFLEELKHAGVKNPRNFRLAEGDERNEAKRVLMRLKWNVPETSPAFIADPPEDKSLLENLLCNIMCEKLDYAALVSESKQTKLIPD
ncbi:MAG: hypothetical protein GX369_01115 [Euryarchaeota archaeon]|nr:hypothetical protein [Euryarchaeota archaeon]